MIVDRGQIHAGGTGDQPQRGAVKSLFGKELFGSIQYVLLGIPAGHRLPHLCLKHLFKIYVWSPCLSRRQQGEYFLFIFLREGEPFYGVTFILNATAIKH